MTTMKRLFSTFFIFCISFFCFAQTSQKYQPDQSFFADYVIKSWTTEDGLPGMTITSLMQDKTGYIWIGTYDGLVRFDGVEFVTYSRTADPRFDFAAARSLCQSEDGTIWIGHNDEGLTSYLPGGEIRKYTIKKKYQ